MREKRWTSRTSETRREKGESVEARTPLRRPSQLRGATSSHQHHAQTRAEKRMTNP